MYLLKFTLYPALIIYFRALKQSYPQHSLASRSYVVIQCILLNVWAQVGVVNLDLDTMLQY